jgi:hypothetical protein
MAELRTCEGVSTPTFGLGNGVVTYFTKLSLRILFGRARGWGWGAPECEINDCLSCGNLLISSFDNLRTVDGTNIHCVFFLSPN